jgi:hypothetical protein
MRVIAFVDALPSGAAIWTRASAFTSASLLAMLTDIAPFFDEMFTGWRLAFLISESRTSGLRSSVSDPFPGISEIRSSVIQVGFESTSRAGLSGSHRSFVDFGPTYSEEWAVQRGRETAELSHGPHVGRRPLSSWRPRSRPSKFPGPSIRRPRPPTVLRLHHRRPPFPRQNRQPPLFRTGMTESGHVRNPVRPSTRGSTVDASQLIRGARTA